jgi:hypothetical protein
MKNDVFWDVALRIFCMNQSFGGTYRLHLQGRKIRERGTSVIKWPFIIPSTFHSLIHHGGFVHWTHFRHNYQPPQSKGMQMNLEER